MIRAITGGLKGVSGAGFYTEEIRQGGQRTGFRIVTLDGREATLASLRGHRPTVGKYSVHVEEFEEIVLPYLEPETTPANLYVIDEIGKMELLSGRFRRKITELLDEPINLLATLSKKGDGPVDQIKRRRDVEIIEVTRKNRNELPEALLRKINAIKPQ